MKRLISSLLIALVFPLSAANAECRNCDALNSAFLIGIKKQKQYVKRIPTVFSYSKEKKAKQAGYTKFKSCNASSSVEKAKKKKKSRCNPVYAFEGYGIYFCPKQLKAFNSVPDAIAAGFTQFTNCGADPIVEPKPLTREFQLESGSRFSDVDAISVARLPNDNYRSYYSRSISPFDNDTLRFTNSTDGLTFGSGTVITGITPDDEETLGNPSIIARDNGSYIMFFEVIRHISSGAVDLHNLMRAESSDGLNFTFNPEFVVITDGSQISTHHNPSALLTGQNTVRLYHDVSNNTKTLVSTDLGITFGEPETVEIVGSSDTFAPFPNNPSIVRENSGTYLMVFSSPTEFEGTDSSLFLADSTDGVNFHVFDPPLLTAPENTDYFDPAVVILPNGLIRVYFIERAEQSGTVTRTVKSLLSTS